MNEVPVRLLRATLQARGPADSSPDCLDAETVAAWADDTLGRDERMAAEAHAADCGRCQALVAATVQTSPPAAVRSWWRAPVMGWLVPLTAAAAALLVWMSVPGTSREDSSRFVSRAIEQVPPQPSVGAASNSPPDAGLPAPVVPDAARANRQGQAKGARAGAQRSPADRGSEPAAIGKTLSGVAGGAVASVPSMPSANAVPLPQPAETESPAAAGPPVGAPRTAVAQLELANARNLRFEARRPPTVIASTNPASQWRILPNGAVQHSTDGGTTWEARPTGVTEMLTAGASPAPSICWLVGPQGIVLLSTDGRSWRRIAFPESADLTSVRATDDKSATVNTADGRAFSTTDGGRTWTR